MSNQQVNQMWGVIKWILGVISAVGFYLASYTFNNFSNKLDEVHEFSTTGSYRIDRLEKDQEKMREDLTVLFNRPAQYVQQMDPNAPRLNHGN
jgi:hypothetical protein